MNIISMMRQIGDDADLLIRSDDWLESERIATATRMDRLAKELRALLLAQRIKTRLQQMNLVAVLHLLKSVKGETQDMVIKIMKLPDAVKHITNNDASEIDQLNALAQMLTWEKDGYDIPSTCAVSTN